MTNQKRNRQRANESILHVNLPGEFHRLSPPAHGFNVLVNAMASPSQLSLKQLRDFHHIDRIAYSRLITLNSDPFHAMKIVAFWNTLEKIGIKHLVYNLERFSDSSLFSLAKDSVLCLQCLYSSSQQIFPWLRLDFPEMNKLVSQEILLGFLVKNREILKRMIKGFVKDVCEAAFLQQNLGHKRSYPYGGQPNSVTATDENKEVLKEGKIDWEDKTLFMTFSRGHPVSNKEIKGFIAGKFGSRVEAICMDKNPKQRLFACVVLKSHADMSRIVGTNKLAQHVINGKQVRVRRFVPKSNFLMKTG
ncbi:putative Major facilitator superfamily protein [Hibiscus syriacus]|uniref:Major facilitator superfamily protein n=1 Tax=Hibiscus syriacus TaxID=106335 RepID=A0A6A3B516_HIBSY|nr:putative Major facilitator superfamily protein [Hibiscus syriacus]